MEQRLKSRADEGPKIDSLFISKETIETRRPWAVATQLSVVNKAALLLGSLNNLYQGPLVE